MRNLHSKSSVILSESEVLRTAAVSLRNLHSKSSVILSEGESKHVFIQWTYPSHSRRT